MSGGWAILLRKMPCSDAVKEQVSTGRHPQEMSSSVEAHARAKEPRALTQDDRSKEIYLSYRSATASSMPKNSGNEMLTHSAPAMRVSPSALSAATAKAMAMR